MFGPTRKSAEQPSATQTPLSSYPHVLPRRQAESPYDLRSTTPRYVSAGHSCRSPTFDEHEIVTAVRCCGVDGCDCAVWAYPAALHDRHTRNRPHRTRER